MMKRAAISSVILLTSMFFTQAMADCNIAVIDMKVLVEKSSQMKKMKDQLQAKFAPRHDELVNPNKALAKSSKTLKEKKLYYLKKI